MRDAGHRTPDAGRRTSDIGHRTSDGEKSKNNISTPQGGGHNKPDLAHRTTNANLYSPERQLTKASEPSFDLEGGAQGQI